jgi:hypothetical protein
MSKKKEETEMTELAKVPELAQPAVVPVAGRAPEWAKPKNEGKRFAIRTPNPQFNGERAGVRFQEGVAFTDAESSAETFRLFGYEVVDTAE